VILNDTRSRRVMERNDWNSPGERPRNAHMPALTSELHSNEPMRCPCFSNIQRTRSSESESPRCGRSRVTTFNVRRRDGLRTLRSKTDSASDRKSARRREASEMVVQRRGSFIAIWRHREETWARFHGREPSRICLLGGM